MGQVVIVDAEGRQVGVGVADVLARAGAIVTLATPYGTVAPHLPTYGHYVGPRMRCSGVRLLPNTSVVKIAEGGIELQNFSGVWSEPAETVVMATMRSPLNALVDTLEQCVEYVYPIGDALSPRSLIEATYEGHRFAHVVGEPDMPKTVIDALMTPLPGFRPAAMS
jgi:hypothetical protein